MGTSIDYSAVAHETIYQRLTGGPGSLDLMGASRGWESVATTLEELRGQVEQAIRGIGAAQQGASADAATNATMVLMPWLEDTAIAARALADRISNQADSFGYTEGNMPPPVKVPEVSFSQNPWTYLGQHAVEWLPGIQTEHERAEVAAQQAEARAQELMTSYQSASNDNLAISQHFAMAPAVVAGVSDPALGGSGGGASAGGSAAHGTPYAGAAQPAVAHSSSAAATGHAASVAPAGTAPQIASGIHQAPAAASSPQLAGGLPGPDGQSAAGSGQGRASAAAAFGPSPMLAGSGPANSEYRARGGSRVSGAGVGRSGGFGPRPDRVLSEGYSPTGSVGQASAEQHAGASRAAARGGGGWGGVPLGATGGTGRDNDAEHQRPSYLIEPDTNAIVGELPQVAPPVIGAD